MLSFIETDYTKHIYFDILDWQDSNPPPSTIMVIMDNLDPVFSSCLATLLQDHKHNLFLAYLYRPRKMSALLSSAEWLWESLLAGVCLSSHHPVMFEITTKLITLSLSYIYFFLFLFHSFRDNKTLSSEVQ